MTFKQIKVNNSVVTNINDNVTGSDDLIKNSGLVKEYGYEAYNNVDNALLKLRHIVDTYDESSVGNRYCIIFKVNKGDIVHFQSSFELGILTAIYNTKNDAIYLSRNYIQIFGEYAYETTPRGGVVDYDGYLSITTRKIDNSAITDAEINQFLDTLDLKINSGLFKNAPCGIITPDWKYGRLMNIDTNNHTIDFGTETLISVGRTVYSIYLLNLQDYHNFDFYVPSAYTVKIIFNLESKLIEALPWSDDIFNSVILGFVRYKKNENNYMGFLSAVFSCDFTVDGKPYPDNFVYNNSGIKNKMYLGKLVQQSTNQTGLDEEINMYRVSSHDAIALPHIGCKVLYHLPKNIQVGVRHGYRGANLINNDYWFGDGETFTFPSTSIYYRFSFSDTESGEIYLDDVINYIDAGLLYIEIIENYESNIVDRNTVQEKFLKSMMLNLDNYRIGDMLKTYPIIVHASDVHGDYYRLKNLYEFSKSINADAIVVTGDICAYQPKDGQTYLEYLDDSYNIPTIVCTGNHDTSYLTTDISIYNQIIKHFSEKYEIGSQTSYYYQDVNTINVRFISLNLYDGGHPGEEEYCNIFSTQMNWFIETLRTTPNNYGIIVLMHSPETEIVAAGQDTSFISTVIDYPHYHDGMTGTPLTNIIESFRNRTSGSTTYKNYSESEETTVTFDFRNVDNSVKFIAFVSGHQHEDRCGYNIGTTQIHLNNTCTIGAYGLPSYPYFSNVSDLPRGTQGVTQDSFNVYIIDRSSNELRVVKIGSTLTKNFVERSHTIIPII